MYTRREMILRQDPHPGNVQTPGSVMAASHTVLLEPFLPPSAVSSLPHWLIFGVFILTCAFLKTGQLTFSFKRQDNKYFRPCLPLQCQYSHMQINGHGRVPIKLYLQKLAVSGSDLSHSCSKIILLISTIQIIARDCNKI